MKRMLIFVLVMLFAVSSLSFAENKEINTVKEGEVEYSAGHYLAGEIIPLGFDMFGYNYNAHMFKGSYYNSYAGSDGYAPYMGDDDSYLEDNSGAASLKDWPNRNTKLTMKWNEAWLSSADRDLDGKLDRHDGFKSYIDSGAWLTNHQSWTDAEGEHSYFVKIVAVTSDDKIVDGMWHTADGIEIGEVIWGEFATILHVEDGEILYESAFNSGFGSN